LFLIFVTIPAAGCDSPGDYRDTLSERRFRHVPLWAIPITLLYAPCRVTCPVCKSVHVESMPWTAGQKRPERSQWQLPRGQSLAVAAGASVVDLLILSP